MNLSALQSILEFAVVLAALIFIHELGHFLVCRLFKIEVEEFGFGLPPRALRFWRSKGSLTVGQHTLVVPPNFQWPFDPKDAQQRGVEVTARQVKDHLWLESIALAASEDGQYRPTQREPVPQADGKLRFDGILHQVSQGTELTLNWLPLGGFVRPKGENDPTIPNGLAAAPPLTRIAVYLAGPTMNILLAVVLYIFILSQIGVVPQLDTVLISGTAAGSPAEQAGLQANDQVLYAAGQRIVSISQLQNVVRQNLGVPMTLVYLRNGQRGEITLVPRLHPPEGEGALGIVLTNPTRPFRWITAIPDGVQMTIYHARILFQTVGQLFSGTQQGRVMGIVGMADTYSEVRQNTAADGKLAPIVISSFVIDITISLGVLNLLPIPALDGGRILLALPEIVIRRRVPPKYETWLIGVSFLLLIGLLILVNISDVFYLFRPIPTPTP